MSHENLGGTNYFLTDDFGNDGASKRVRHGFTRYSSAEAHELAYLCTLFCISEHKSVIEAEIWFERHMRHNHPNIPRPMHSNTGGVAVAGHLLPLNQFCNLLMAHLAKKSHHLTIEEWIPVALPSSLKGYIWGLTFLQLKNVVHGKIESGIFVGSKDLTLPFDIKQVVNGNLPITGYIADTEFVKDSFNDRARVADDIEKLFNAMFSALKFPIPDTTENQIRETLEYHKQDRLVSFLTVLKKVSVSKIQLLGYFAAYFWRSEQEMEFMEILFKVLFRQIARYDSQYLDDAFGSLVDWQGRIHDYDLNKVLKHKQEEGNVEEGNVVPEGYKTCTSFIQIFRNCMEHLPQAGKLSVEVFQNMYYRLNFDFIQAVHECMEDVMNTLDSLHKTRATNRIISLLTKR